MRTSSTSLSLKSKKQPQDPPSVSPDSQKQMTMELEEKGVAEEDGAPITCDSHMKKIVGIFALGLSVQVIGLVLVLSLGYTLINLENTDTNYYIQQTC